MHQSAVLGEMPGLAARSDTSLVANIDLAPTIAAWAGIVPPAPVNGMNLLPLLQNPNAAWRSGLDRASGKRCGLDHFQWSGPPGTSITSTRTATGSFMICKPIPIN